MPTPTATIPTITPTPAPAPAAEEVPSIAGLNLSGSESDDDLSPPATPIMQPSALHAEPTVLLTLTSFALAIPLQPTPDLKYDLRTLPSSEKHVRSKYDGRTKKFREWLSREEAYVDLLSKVENEVLAKGRELEEEAKHEKADKEKAEAEKAELAKADAEKAEQEKAEIEKAENGKVEPEVEPQTPATDSAPEPSEAAESVAGDDDREVLGKAKEPVNLHVPKNLRVGVSCEMGHHSSVAFVEELGRRKWPVEWAVEVVHRDVDKQRNPRKGKARGNDKGGRKRNVQSGEHVSEE
ncbi:hypothetical protein HWV62_18024 [Athelia sp. TMB]|nr:hypothetical protein HWV62_18024 [Athelia sp. TMB]